MTKGNRLFIKADGTPLKGIIWAEEGWILRSNPPSYFRHTSAFHRHKIDIKGDGDRECMLNTQAYPGWVCRQCNRTAPNGMQALYVMMNWEIL